MKNVGIRSYVGMLSEVKSAGRFSFWATTRVAPTKYRRAKKRLHATSLQRNGSHKLFAILGRGYTGHEHLLDHDIINMNGRIYDPVTAQFMQADNYISSPEDYISYNRYAYCLYNPFKYTDPSGEYYVYYDPAFLNEVSADTQGAGRYWVDDPNSMLVEELARLNAWMLDEDVTRPPMASKGGGGGVGSNPGAPVQEKPTVMDLLLKKKEKEVEKFKERAEKIAKAKKANKANEYVALNLGFLWNQNSHRDFNEDNVPNQRQNQQNDLYAYADGLVLELAGTAGLMLTGWGGLLIDLTTFIPSDTRRPEPYEASHKKGARSSTHDKHTKRRPDKEYGNNRNNHRGDKNKKKGNKEIPNVNKYGNNPDKW